MGENWQEPHLWRLLAQRPETETHSQVTEDSNVNICTFLAGGSCENVQFKVNLQG